MIFEATAKTSRSEAASWQARLDEFFEAVPRAVVHLRLLMVEDLLLIQKADQDVLSCLEIYIAVKGSRQSKNDTIEASNIAEELEQVED